MQRLNFIRHARELGFEVDQIRELLTLSDQPHRPCSEADAIAREHLIDIESKIARLTALRAEVQRMLASCAHGSIADCHVIEVLADHAHCRHGHGAIRKPLQRKRSPRGPASVVRLRRSDLGPNQPQAGRGRRAERAPELIREMRLIGEIPPHTPPS